MKKLSIQEYLSLGYIYLVVLGMISDVIYFKFFYVPQRRACARILKLRS